MIHIITIAKLILIDRPVEQNRIMLDLIKELLYDFRQLMVGVKGDNVASINDQQFAGKDFIRGKQPSTSTPVATNNQLWIEPIKHIQSSCSCLY